MLHLNYSQPYQVTMMMMWSLLVAPSWTMGTVQSQGPSLSQLRAEYAMRFIEPAPHMALAKYFRDKGNRLEAFNILETARRGRFEEDEFNRAFASAFRESKLNNSQAAEWFGFDRELDTLAKTCV